MPITGVFNADFSDFYNAVQQADVRLVDMEADAQKVDRTVNRMFEQFSGKKVMQDAAQITAAIEQIGGVSKLTEAEIAKIGPQVNNAVEKLRLMGEQVPEGLQKIADETKGANVGFKDMLGTVQGIGAAFGVALSIQGVIDFGKHILDTADQIGTMSDKLGISIERVQALKYIAESSGSNLDALAAASARFRTSLDDPAAQQAIRDLGLSLDELKRSDPYDALHRTAEAVAAIEDPTKRAEAAAALYGKQWQEIMPTLTADWEKLGRDAEVSSAVQVKALKAASDELKKYSTQIDNAAIGQAGRGFMALTEALEGNSSVWVKLQAGMIGALMGPTGMIDALSQLRIAEERAAAGPVKDINLAFEPAPADAYAASLDKLSKQFGGLTAAEKEVVARAHEMGQSATEIATGLNKAVGPIQKYISQLDESTAAAKKMSDAQRELASVGTDWRTTLAGMNQETVKTVTSYAQAGASLQSLATVYRLTDTQVKAVTESIKFNQAAMQAEQKEVDKTQDAYRTLAQVQTEHSTTATEKMMQNVTTWFNNEVAKLDFSTNAWREHYDVIAAIANERLKNVEINWDQLQGTAREDLQDTATRAQATYEYVAGQTGKYTTEQIEHYRTLAEESQAAVDTWGEAAVGSAEQINKAMETAVSGIHPVTGAVQSSADAFKNLGEGANMVLATVANGTKSAQQATSDLMFALAGTGVNVQQVVDGMKDAIEQMQKGSALMGAMYRAATGFSTFTTSTGMTAAGGTAYAPSTTRSQLVEGVSAAVAGLEFNARQNQLTTMGPGSAPSALKYPQPPGVVLPKPTTTTGGYGAPSGAWGNTWTINVNAMQGINGDQIASELVAGMRRRGVGGY